MPMLPERIRNDSVCLRCTCLGGVHHRPRPSVRSAGARRPSPPPFRGGVSSSLGPRTPDTARAARQKGGTAEGAGGERCRSTRDAGGASSARATEGTDGASAARTAPRMNERVELCIGISLVGEIRRCTRAPFHTLTGRDNDLTRATGIVLATSNVSLGRRYAFTLATAPSRDHSNSISNARKRGPGPSCR